MTKTGEIQIDLKAVDCYGELTLATEVPRYALSPNDGRDLLSKALLHYRPPRYQTKTHAIVEHREATAGKLNRTPVEATGTLAFAQRAVSNFISQ